MSTLHSNTVDRIDRKILSSLLINGRESIANMARSVGLSRTAVAERISRMEKSGVIEGYTARIGTKKNADLTNCYLLIKCKNGWKKKVCDSLREIPEIKTISVVGGGFDIITLLEASSLHVMNELCDEAENIPGIKELHSTVVFHSPTCR
ncbi:Lrp/AsnC family transcriptional regulator [Photobacterium galatheae]|nr:Lrp/AsnC family transcriptional regulator [Photobacterium galatheae]MCM0150202.1 Lrp/AsnC family transcriptional regulator [Photobacterium galatheae]